MYSRKKRWCFTADGPNFEANSRDGGEESFIDEACGNDDDDSGVPGEENK